ncbi:MAG: hypothetical protein AB8G18_06315 [Gammaproteobacteria bacterium]
MNHTITKLAALALTALCASQASAYTTWTCQGEKAKWDSNTVNLRYSSVSFPAGSWRNSINAAMDRVNDNPSNFRYTRSYGDTSLGLDNGQNETWFSSSASVLNGNPAVAYVYRDCVDYWIFGLDNEIVEADIIYSSAVNYTTSMSTSSLWGYSGAARPLQTTAIHELGHGAGLKHTANTYNIMGTDWTHIHANNLTARSYLGEDAANGLVYLYGTKSNAGQDIAVTHYKRTGASGEYSSHGKTRLTTSGGGNLSTLTISGETGYRVNKGQTIRAEFTYENNGRTTQNQDVRFVVSTNKYITTYDTTLKTTTKSVGRNTVYTTTDSITIPANLNSGQNYWIGVIFDANGTLAETTEANNATYLPIRVN